MFANNEVITLYNTAGKSADYKVISLLGKSKFQVYKVSDSQSRIFALKVYPKGHQAFEEEARFQFLSHKHLAAPRASGLGEHTIFKSDFEIENQEFNYVLTPYCPNGDLYNMLINIGYKPDEKVVRSMFKQLVEALEYMHGNGTAHGDIKLENIFIDENMNLKLADFDLAFKEGDLKLSRGSVDYRALEVVNVEFYDPYKSDIFSLGVLLFVLHNGCQMPFFEAHPQAQWDFYFNPQRYWTEMIKLIGCEEDIWSEDFKELFIGMTKLCPSERFTFEEIKASKWYKGEMYTEEDLAKLLKKEFEKSRNQH